MKNKHTTPPLAFLKLLILCILLLGISGCGFDSREIDHRSMIVGMALDKGEDDQLEVSFQFPVLGGGGKQDTSPRQKDFEVITSTNQTLLEAIADLEAKSPRVLFFGHLKTVIISEEIARDNLEEFLDVLDRHPQIGNNVYLLIVENQSAKSLIEKETPLVTLPALYLDIFFKADQKLTRTKDIKVFEYIRDSYSVSQATFLPLGRLAGEEVDIKDYAVIKNHRMLGIVRDKDVSYARLLREESISDLRFSTSIAQDELTNYRDNHDPNQQQNEAEVNAEQKENKQEITIDFTRTNLKLKKRYNKTNPVEFNITVTGKGEMRGKNNEDAFTTDDFLQLIEQSVEKDIKDNLEKVIKQHQELNAEPFLLGQYIFATDAAYFDTLEWNERGWQEANFNITVDFTLINTGTRGVLDKKKLGR